MNIGFCAGVTAAALVAGAASAATSVEIRDAAVMVTVVPEARPDVKVSVVRTNPKLPLRISNLGDRVAVNGGLFGRNVNCHGDVDTPGARIWGTGDFGPDDLPRIVIRTPLDVRIRTGAAVFGDIGRAASVDLSAGGCGAWTVANVSGLLRVASAGSGDVHAGSAGSAQLRIGGAGGITMRDVAAGLDASTAGSGDMTIASVRGPLRARIVGSGDIIVNGGGVTTMDATVLGAGDIKLSGVAQSLNARILGSGDVAVDRVSGPVNKSVMGSGSVSVGG
jgi:hypothetical protein